MLSFVELGEVVPDAVNCRSITRIRPNKTLKVI